MSARKAVKSGKTSSQTRGGRKAGGLILVVDVGNTTSVFGLFRGEELVLDLRISSEAQRTADEYAALLLPLFQHGGDRRRARSRR